ncbi:MAG: ABC transporter permease [Acidobacteria bacterium]|nr:ABC transporter permease [Acidobacteriota bacterium]MBI3663940.1 ABC transporter permease [Acidobacteriota bacterium]
MTRAEWKESLGIALQTMRSQKLRSFLTMLGVVIGVASVISVAAIISGLNQHISDKVHEIGSQSFFITRFRLFTVDFERLDEEIRQRKYLKPEDAVAIREQCPSVFKASPILTRALFLGGSNEIRYKNRRVDEPILRGAEPELVDVLPIYQVRDGRFLTHDENTHAAQVTLLGSAIAANLFGAEDPLGKEVRVNGLPFTVIGVFEPHQGLFGGPGVDDFVIIPYRTFAKMYPEIEEVIIAVCTSDAALLPRAQEEVAEVLRRRRNVPASKKNDFEITSPDLLTDLWESLTSAIVMLTLIIASIGLLVGGIGVMNIMLVSVTERTSEIGVRKAVGARKKDIGAQFLLESVAITSVGGMLGVVSGIVFSVSVAAVFPNLPARVSILWTVVGLLLSVAVGLFFGIYPAVKAAGMDPVRCLRYE